jgi:hypothetical protein
MRSFTNYSSDDQIKDDYIGGTCTAHDKDKMPSNILEGKRERSCRFKDPWVDGRINKRCRNYEINLGNK